MKNGQEQEVEQDRMLPVSTSTTLRASDTLSIADLRCPECGHTDSFVIEAGECLLFHAEGSVMPGDCGMEWGERSYCRCHACEHAGTVQDFAAPPPATGQHPKS